MGLPRGGRESVNQRPGCPGAALPQGRRVRPAEQRREELPGTWAEPGLCEGERPTQPSPALCHPGIWELTQGAELDLPRGDTFSKDYSNSGGSKGSSERDGGLTLSGGRSREQAAFRLHVNPPCGDRCRLTASPSLAS